MAFKLPFGSKDDDYADHEDKSVSDADHLSTQQFNSIMPVTEQGAASAQLNADGEGDVVQPAPAASLMAGRDLRLPVIGHMPLAQQIRILLVLLGLSLLLAILFVWINSNNSILTSTQTQIASDALMHSQRIGKAAPNAIQGNLEAFKQLVGSRNDFNRDLKVLSNGGDYQGREIAPPADEMKQYLKDSRTAWKTTDESALIISNLKNELTGFGQTLEKMKALTPQLQELSEQISTLKVQGGASPREISAAGQLVMLTQRLGKSANEFVTSEGVSPETSFLLGKDASTFRDIIDGFMNGSEVLRLTASKDQETRDKLTELQVLFNEYHKTHLVDFGQLAKIHCCQASGATNLW